MTSHAPKPHSPFLSVPQGHLGLLASLLKSASLLAVNWYPGDGGQRQARKPRGPRLCALLPYALDMPVGWPRADGHTGLQHCPEKLPASHHLGGHLGPLTFTISATPKSAVDLRMHPCNTAQASSTGPRPEPLMGHEGTCALASAQPHTLGTVSFPLWASVRSFVHRAVFCTHLNRKG